MGIFGKIVATVINVATLPVAESANISAPTMQTSRLK
jgi:hypothetical protein